MLIVLMIPNQPATAEVPAASAQAAPADGMYLPMTCAYRQNVQRPHENIDLNGYQKVRKLGQGAFGAVYLVPHLLTGEQIAPKELEPDLSNDRQRISFQREVSILATMKHPALLSLHGCTPFQRNGDRGPCILMPYMSGGSIDQYIKAEQKSEAPATWDPTRKFIILLGVASGMMFMHDSRMIHRDLNPANILLDENMEPKVADFGLSKFVQPGQSMYQTMRDGTSQFMAPELYLEEGYDFKVDVYAFGVIMFMIVTGLEASKNITNQVILARKVLNGERPTITDSLGASLQDLISRLAHEP
jgi:serine/threonine protein kinase